MADLGAIGELLFVDGDYLFDWEIAGNTYYTLHPKDGLRRDGIFGGNVKTAGVNEPNVEVLIFWRNGMHLIARTWTDANGDWEMTGFDPTRAADYVIVYKDPETGSVYNDAIYSLISPA